MKSNNKEMRREFLRFLAASPLITSWQALAAETEELLGTRLRDPSDVINVFEMEKIASEKVPPAHFGYLISGTDGDGTLHANRLGFTRFQIHPRRLVNVSKLDTSLNLLGAQANSPIFLSPLGGLAAFHRDGDTGVARAAAKKNTHMVISTQASHPIEEVIAARNGQSLWFQLYSTNKWEYTEALLKRAEKAGCSTVCLTIDLPGGRNTETASRLARHDDRFCEECHYPGKTKPMFEGLDMQGVGLVDSSLTWDVIPRMKEATSMNIVIKGLETAYDADQAVAHGADGILVSNHGGRATDTGRGTIECLPEVIAAVNGRIPVMLDGGVRRGTDVFKALALGAKAVGIGRSFAWGLGAFGQAGVERVIDLLNRELAICLRGSGVISSNDVPMYAVQDLGSRQADLIYKELR
jgi:4-hydroxymandelate oxidase